MTKKELQKRVEELEDLVNHQKRLIDLLYIQLDEKQITFDSEACPFGGKHQYVLNDTRGWHCKCGKTQPYQFSPSITTNNNDTKL